MLDHMGIAVADFNRSKTFNEQTLLPLSVVLLMEVTADQPRSGAHADSARKANRFSGSAMADARPGRSTLRSPPRRVTKLTLSIAPASPPEE